MLDCSPARAVESSMARLYIERRVLSLPQSHFTFGATALVQIA